MTRSTIAVRARHEPEIARDHLIVALDVPDIDQASALVHQLGASISFYKIGGHLLFAKGMVEFVEKLVQDEKRVFLDFKSVDIGETMRNVSSAASALGVEFITVMGTRANIEAAVAGRGSRRNPKVLVVTLLTDHSQEEMRQEYHTDETIEEFVIRRARMVKHAGGDGVISSPLEVAPIRRNTEPGFLIVTPGVRPAGSPADDQKRVATPAAAVSAGADYLVLGRPIIRADKPREATQLILDEMQAVLDARR
jgi:orotidine-5'-phosphate decarboxylase